MHAERLNRTFMELKLSLLQTKKNYDVRLNRTFMELKQSAMLAQYNRDKFESHLYGIETILPTGCESNL